MFNYIREFISDLGRQYFQQPEVSEEAKVNLMNLLPQEITLEIFSYLNSKELTRCFRVNKTWKILASDETLWNVLTPRIAFGKKQWETYFGDIGQEPPLPKDIHKILNSHCPFWSGKKVKKTHMLVLIPETIDGKPLNLATLVELAKKPKEGHATPYQYIKDAIIKEHGNQAITKSHWVLMTKEVIEESRDKSIIDQQTLIAKIAKRKGINYEIPPVLDAAICILMHYTRSRKRLFKIDSDYTLCQQTAKGSLNVVGLSPNGLSVVDYYDAYPVGISALRKLS